MENRGNEPRKGDTGLVKIGSQHYSRCIGRWLSKDKETWPVCFSGKWVKWVKEG